MTRPDPLPTVLRHRALAFLIALSAFVFAPASAIPADFEIPKVEASMFDEEILGMMEFERQKMAEYLAAFVVNRLAKNVVDKDASAVALAERLVGLALHLDPRNRTALVAGFQFRRGLVPKEVAEMYEPSVLAELLVARADFLSKRAGIDNEVLAGYFLAIAVEIDPENENAVFQYLIWERAGKTVDWSAVTGRKRDDAPSRE